VAGSPGRYECLYPPQRIIIIREAQLIAGASTGKKEEKSILAKKPAVTLFIPQEYKLSYRMQGNFEIMAF
jgi:hypothetical protein